MNCLVCSTTIRWGSFRGGRYCQHCGTWWGADEQDAEHRLAKHDPIMPRFDGLRGRRARRRSTIAK